MKKIESLKLFCSLPEIVTTTKPRRINEKALENQVIKQYITLLGEALKTKKRKLEDIKITYIGGYKNIEDNGEISNNNLNTAMLYAKALQNCLKSLGYGEIKLKAEKCDPFTIIDKETYEQDKEKSKKTIEESDLLILGIGSDQVFGDLLETLAKDGIMINDIIEKNNIIMTSFCAGSVLSAKRIYGGKYDEFYDNEKSFIYPQNYQTLNNNPVTMETNLFSPSQTKSKNQTFKEKYLLPDSINKAFFGCRPNSFIIGSEEIVYGYGEIYLYIDGVDYLICSENQKVDFTSLNKLVNQYNETKTAEVKKAINQELKKLNLSSLEQPGKEQSILLRAEIAERKARPEKYILEENMFTEFSNLNMGVTNYPKICEERFLLLQNRNLLTSLSLREKSIDNGYEEFYLKQNIISLVQKYRNIYQTKYQKDADVFYYDMLGIMNKLVKVFPKLVMYFMECFASCYSSDQIKEILLVTNQELSDMKNKEINKSLKALKDKTKERNLIIERGLIYESRN